MLARPAVAALAITGALGAPAAAAPSTTAATPALTLEAPRVAPSTAFFGGEPVAVSFAVTAPAPPLLHVEVTSDRTGRIARRMVVADVLPGMRRRVTWDGVTGDGRAAADGRYRVRVVVPGTTVRRRLGMFVLRGRTFPIRGRHADRGAIGQFGAGRNGGRTHEGFDVNAPCGTPLVAARAGRVVRSRFDPVLYGHEVVVRGLLDGRTYRYAHLRDRPLVRRGERVRTGQRIGSVGDTGNARTTGCHLHFELRVGGRLVDPRPHLHAWDRWS
ncbi:peptidoglycan DD-metalloendopeptidase family protein [Conexibacter sp. SYSU D00693]|uniref:peptidoglycan DD-metalloendopeptidase family protein n=1 Tax=Conexibacter sp. SYSU D00693 TaxID=2812560 RepID=UPI00196A5A17|nr:peptidoglycan DD-metalloendopeptidase family protein [Conexibacter sp. SYSU D00693]